MLSLQNIEDVSNLLHFKASSFAGRPIPLLTKAESTVPVRDPLRQVDITILGLAIYSAEPSPQNRLPGLDVDSDIIGRLGEV